MADHPELCYCDDPITPHRVNPEWDCHCDGACISECPCHQRNAAEPSQGGEEP